MKGKPEFTEDFFLGTLFIKELLVEGLRDDIFMIR